LQCIEDDKALRLIPQRLLRFPQALFRKPRPFQFGVAPPE
jgi:hypothetical protein